VPNVEAEMERELPRMFLRFLGVSHEELGKSRKPGAKS
jgi:hypothetical protein